MVLKTFKTFLEEEDNAIQNIESNPTYKLKNNFSEEINSIMQWIQQNPEAKYEEIKNRMLNFRNNIASLNIDLLKNISNYAVEVAYKKIYDKLIRKLNEFENPPSDVKAILDEVFNILNSFHAFIQSKIAVAI